MAFAPGQFDKIDPERINSEVAHEVLSNAQQLLVAQLASVDSLDGKLTTLLSQTAALATAALGTATAVFWGNADEKWIPANLAAGLAAAGAVWLIGAGLSLWGLRPREWSTPYYRPSKLVNEQVLNASGPAMSYMWMATRLEDAIDQNNKALDSLARHVYLVQISLVMGVLAVAASLLIRGLIF